MATKTPPKAELLKQLQRLRTTGFADLLAKQATAHKFPAPFFFAIASRETNCRNILGDKQKGVFHGVGIIQIDIQHKIALEARDSGSFKTNPEPLIKFGAQLLEDNINAVKKRLPALNPQRQLKVAASGYNHGIKGAIADEVKGDSDANTTDKNYGADVIARMAIFEDLISAGN